MKLEAGKSYYRRDGGVESIVRVENSAGYNVDGLNWFEDGSMLCYGDSAWDLISEVPIADQASTETADAGLSVVRKGDALAYKSLYEKAVQDRADEHIELHQQLAEAREQRDSLIEALEAADECLALIEDVGHGAMMDNVTVARRIVLSAISSANESSDGAAGCGPNSP